MTRCRCPRPRDSLAPTSAQSARVAPSLQMARAEPSDAQTASTAFGELLRQHRLAAGLTQELLAARAGLSAHGIQKLEHGTTRPYRATVQRLALALELSPDDQVLFWASGQPAPRQRQLTSRLSVSPEPSYQHNLPTPLTSFIGRERELSDVQVRLGGARLRDSDGRGWLRQDTAGARGIQGRRGPLPRRRLAGGAGAAGRRRTCAADGGGGAQDARDARATHRRCTCHRRCEDGACCWCWTTASICWTPVLSSWTPCCAPAPTCGCSQRAARPSGSPARLRGACRRCRCRILVSYRHSPSSGRTQRYSCSSSEPWRCSPTSCSPSATHPPSPRFASALTASPGPGTGGGMDRGADGRPAYGATGPAPPTADRRQSGGDTPPANASRRRGLEL